MVGGGPGKHVTEGQYSPPGRKGEKRDKDKHTHTRTHTVGQCEEGCMGGSKGVGME